MPGLLLVVLYIIYCLAFALLKKDAAPPMPRSNAPRALQYWQTFKAIIPALTLVMVVLGTVIAGVATPTESAAMGAVGAVMLALIGGKLRFSMLHQVAMETTKISAMVFTILAGATFFSMVFTYTGGDEAVEQIMEYIPGGKWGFVVLMMIVIFLLGFFIDFVEIAYIFVPMISPILLKLDIDPLWFIGLITRNGHMIN